MATIKLPAAAETVKTGTVRKWLVAAGDKVAKGAAIVEVETEAGLLTVESPVEGRLSQVLAQQGKTVAVHGPLAVIEGEGATAVSEKMEAKAASAAPAAASGKVIPILMPKAGQSMEEGKILKWRVEVGAIIKKGDVIFEVETDKANMDVEAQDAGRLARIVVKEDQSLGVLLPVAYLAESDADVEAYLGGGGLSGAPGVQAVSAPTGLVAESAHAGRLPEYQERGKTGTNVDGRVKASPAARKIAAERGVDLQAVAMGSGPGGRILSTDVPAAGAVATAGAPAAANRRKMVGMRKAIAKSLQFSKQNIPHFYVRLTVDAGAALAFYQGQKALYPCSINDVIVAACAKLLKEFPPFRCRLEGEEIIEAPTANIGIAVGMDEGLVVPVITGADRLTLQQLAGETRRLAAAARSGKIEGMGTGSFTITNLGMFGTEEFAAIINP
ncbi:MAG TPA: 2-oxo acid dehydrogenase subunit E2, partial [Tepidisphaeraceae bacterium]|nr:2-oxo acid dehydrogenase subunit E2 [Tepidisphaeraceae bacterium]